MLSFLKFVHLEFPFSHAFAGRIEVVQSAMANAMVNILLIQGRCKCVCVCGGGGGGGGGYGGYIPPKLFPNIYCFECDILMSGLTEWNLYLTSNIEDLAFLPPLSFLPV